MRGVTLYILIICISFLMLSGIFAPGIMSGYDNSIHHYEVYCLSNTLIPKYHWISGWTMQGMAGCPILLHHAQTGFLLIAFLNKALNLPLTFSYKLVVLLSYILCGAGFYKLSSYRFGKIPSFIMTLCLLMQQNIYYDNILCGMWSNFLAIGLFFIFFHLLDKSANSFTVRSILILGLLLGLIIPTHLFTALSAFIIIFIYSIYYCISSIRRKLSLRPLFSYLAISGLAISVSAYYLYGFVAAGNYFDKVYMKDILVGIIYSLKSLFGPISGGAGRMTDFIFNIPVILRVIFSFTGLCIFLIKEKEQKYKRFLKYTLSFTILSLALFSDALRHIFKWWNNMPLLGSIETTRLIIFAQFGMYIFAAYGLMKFFDMFKKKFAINSVFLLIIAPALVFNYNHAKSLSQTLSESGAMPDVYRVWDWVNDNIEPGTRRIVYQSTVDNVNDPILRRSDVFSLSGIFTQVPQIGTFLPASRFPQEKFMRTDEGMIFTKKISEAEDSFIAERMQYYNAQYIVSAGQEMKKRLIESELFKEEKDLNSFGIFRLVSFKDKFIAFDKSAAYDTMLYEDQHLIFDIMNNASGNKAFIKVAYHPFWRAYLNGKAVPVSKDKYALMEIALPEKMRYKLELSFKYFNPFWAFFSLFTLSLSLCAIFIGKYNEKKR